MKKLYRDIHDEYRLSEIRYAESLKQGKLIRDNHLKISFKTSILLLFLLLMISSVQSATRTSSQSGNWNTISTWGGSSVPVAGDDVVIAGGHTITVTAVAACRSILFNSTGSTLTVNNGITLTVSGTGYGTVTLNSSDANWTNSISGEGALICNSLSIGTDVSISSSNKTISLTSSIASLTVSGNLSISSYRNNQSGNQRYLNAFFYLATGTVRVNGSVTLYEENSSNTTTISLASGSSQNGLLDLGGATPFNITNGTPSITLNGTASTVNYSRSGAQTVYGTTYTNLTLSGTGTNTKTLQTGTTSIGGDFTLSGTAATSTVVGLTVGGNLTVETGTSLTLNGFNFGVSGKTTLDGTLPNSSTTGTKTFNGDVIIGSLGNWRETANEDISFGGSLQNDGTLTAGTGIHTFTGSGKAFSGTSAIAIPNITINGTYTNNGSLTVGTALAGSGTLTQGTTGVLNIGGTSTITSFDPSATGNTVNYTGSSSQTILGDKTFYNLSTGSGGVVQTAGISTLYSQSFETAPSDWITEIVTDPGTNPTITYVTSTTSAYPNVTPTLGSNCVEFNSYSAPLGAQIRLKKNTSPLSTTGKTNITVVFDWYMDDGYSAANDYVTVQYSTNGSSWVSSSSYYRYSLTNGWITNSCLLPVGAENQSTLYIAFLFTSSYGNNCHLDNMKLDFPTTGVSSTITINGEFKTTNGTYTIGADNSLILNGTTTGSNAIVGSTTSNLTVGGTGANLTLPSITTGLNNFAVNRANGVTLGSSLPVAGILDLTSGALSIGNNTLTLNGTITGDGTLTGDANPVLVIGGTSGGNLGVLNFTDGSGTLLTFTLDRTGSGAAVTLGSNLTVKGNMTITSGILTLLGGKWLTVETTLANTNSANFILESGSSLKQSSANVQATVKREILAADWGIKKDGWHLLSSPVATQAISGGFTPSGANGDYDFYSWYEPENLWINFKNTTIDPTWGQVNGNNNFTVGKGYLVAYENSSTKEFSGSLNYQNVTISLTNNNSSANYSWNLLGNPFPASLIWHTGWTTTSDIAANCQVWDEGLQNYSPILPGGIIPALNGFMVEVNESVTTTSVTIPANKQDHSSDAWYKKTENNNQLLKLSLKASDGNSGQVIYIQENPSSTELFDSEYDGHYLRGYGPVFYSIAGTDTLSVNTLPAFNESLIIPLVFQKNEGADYVLTVSGVENFEVPIYLTDKKTGVIQNLGYNPVYSFSSAEGDNINRFTLSFKSPTSIKEETEEKFTVSVVNGVITLQSDQSLTGTVKVSDMLGRTVAMENMAADSPLQINLNSTPGVYVVSVYTKSKTYSQKVVIR